MDYPGPMAHGSRYLVQVLYGTCCTNFAVFKGKNLAGRMGGDRVTIQKQKLYKLFRKNVIPYQGNVPGA